MTGVEVFTCSCSSTAFLFLTGASKVTRTGMPTPTVTSSATLTELICTSVLGLTVLMVRSIVGSTGCIGRGGLYGVFRAEIQDLALEVHVSRSGL